MAGSITISGIVSATTADLLNDTRLQTVPANGVLTFEFQSTANDASNSHDISIQMPSGDTPMNGTRVPAGVTAGALNANDKMMASYTVKQGGHATVSNTLTGTAVLAYRITYTPVV